MLRLLTILLPLFIWGLAVMCAVPSKSMNADNGRPSATPDETTATASAQTGARAATDTVNIDSVFAALRTLTAGKENEPASSLFKNLKIMDQMTVGQVMGIMRGAFTKALGVKCFFCHVPGDWASDEKYQKNVARDMWRMTGEINQEVNDIFGKQASEQVFFVSCYTCHRGEAVPAVQMPEQDRN